MTVLVTGATGSVGRLVVDELLRAGATDVRALTTNPARARLPREVEVVEGYLGRPHTLPGALEGVDRMYLAPLPETVDDVVALAAEAGVRRIVDLSGEKESWWGSVAGAVEASGLAWTHLSPGEFMSNSTIWADQIRSTGTVRDCDPEATSAQIDPLDVAAVAAKVLLEDGHEGVEYSMTGPEALRLPDLVRRIGDALGRDVPFVEVSREEAIATLEPTMGEYAAWYVGTRSELVEYPQPVSPVLGQLLDRPTTFAEWAVRNVDQFR